MGKEKRRRVSHPIAKISQSDVCFSFDTKKDVDDDEKG